MISARAKQPLARANYLSARKTSRERCFTLSLEFNFGTMGEGTKAGRYVKRPNVIGRTPHADVIEAHAVGGRGLQNVQCYGSRLGITQ